MVNLLRLTIRTITNLPGSSFFPSWTQDGRLAFRYDGAEYHGFMMASDVLSAPERPLAGQRDQRVPIASRGPMSFRTRPRRPPDLRSSQCGVCSDARTPAALVNLQRVSRDFADDRVSFWTATDFGSRHTDVTRMRARYGITLRQSRSHLQRCG